MQPSPTLVRAAVTGTRNGLPGLAPYRWRGTPPQHACQCGCGGEVTLATRTNARLGHVKGQPMRYLPGHNRKSRRPS